MPYRLTNRKRYEDKLAAVARVAETHEADDVTFTPIEFLHVLVEKQNLTPAEFSTTLGYEAHYLDNLMSSFGNTRGDALPKPLQQKLTTLSGTHPRFWARGAYSMEDLTPTAEHEVPRFDFSIDVTAIGTRGSHTATAQESPSPRRR